jgi:hypothetical protein
MAYTSTAYSPGKNRNGVPGKYEMMATHHAVLREPRARKTMWMLVGSNRDEGTFFARGPGATADQFQNRAKQRFRIWPTASQRFIR